MKAPQNNVDESIPLSLSNNFVDKYKGMTDAEMELVDATTDLTTAQKAQKDALTQADYDKASEDVQKYTNKIQSLKTTTDDLTSAQKDLASAQSKIDDLKANYAEDMIGTLSNPGQAAALTKSFNRSMKSDDKTLQSATAAYKEAQVKYGDINITLDGKTAKIPGVAAAGAGNKLYDPLNLSKRTLQQAGYSP